MVFARGIQEIGLKGRVLTERADAGDIVGTSKYFHYSLVGDSKISRLSRTARNQKDFKVEGLNNWRYNHDFAVLCSPYFDYPDRKSQVYESAIARNVSLFTWEYLIFLIENDITEEPTISLRPIWDYSNIYKQKYFPNLNFNSKKKLSRPLTKKVQQRFLDSQSIFINNYAKKIYHGHNFISFDKILINQRSIIHDDAKSAKSYWSSKINGIKKLSRNEAIKRLIKQSKITNKIAYINRYLRRINNDKWKAIFRRFQ